MLRRIHILTVAALALCCSLAPAAVAPRRRRHTPAVLDRRFAGRGIRGPALGGLRRPVTGPGLPRRAGRRRAPRPVRPGPAADGLRGARLHGGRAQAGRVARGAGHDRPRQQRDPRDPCGRGDRSAVRRVRLGRCVHRRRRDAGPVQHRGRIGPADRRPQAPPGSRGGHALSQSRGSTRDGHLARGGAAGGAPRWLSRPGLRWYVRLGLVRA
jgi:hypothetical protein